MATSEALLQKLKAWLDKQGYPTEFQVANVCQRHGFRVFQGSYVSGTETANPREIDVIATRDHNLRDHLIRVEQIIECKWSKDKPWVVLTSSHGQMASGACIAQTIGNLLGSTLLWLLAGDEDLHKMGLFCTPKRPGFGGRQAFTEKNDLVYSAMQSVTDAAISSMARYDRQARPAGVMPENVVIGFPVIVIQGELFAAFFDRKANGMELEPRQHVRCHWRGARSWPFHTTIDILTLEYLNEFLELRAKEIDALLAKLDTKRSEVDTCFQRKSLDGFNVARGSRGIRGLPPLMHELLEK